MSRPRLAQALRTCRQALGLTQRQVAHRARISAGAVAQYELGLRQPSLTVLRRVAKVLGATPSALLK